MTNISGFDLNLLRVLDALLHDPSTVRAGQKLGLSQPAVSAALGRLRLAMGDELFFRRGQGLQPTEFASSLVAPLTDLMDRVQTLLSAEAKFDPSRSDAHFKISGSDFFAEMLMPKLALHLAELAPGMRIHLVDLVPDSYIDTLERYKVDLALVPAQTLPDWIQSRPVFTSSFSVIARKDHPRLKRAELRPGDTIPIDLFCDLGHVLFSPEGNARAMGDASLAKLGRERRVVMTMPVFSGVARAVSGSDLIAILPTPLARRMVPALGLEVYTAPMLLAPAQITMIWHRRFSSSPAHFWLRDQIATLLSSLDEQDRGALPDPTNPRN